MTPASDPAAIARGLTAAQKRALLWLPESVDFGAKAPGRMTQSLFAMSPLWRKGQSYSLTVCIGGGVATWWRLTPLGQSVRAALKEAPNAPR